MAVLQQATEILCIPYRSIGRLLQIIFAPWPSTYEPVKALLNASSEYEQDRFTAEWRDRKLAELTFVGLTVSFPSRASHPALSIARLELTVSRSAVSWRVSSAGPSPGSPWASYIGPLPVCGTALC